MLGKNLIVLEAESVNKLLYMIEFMIRGKGRRKLFEELLENHGDGFRVWQELKDAYKELEAG